MSHAVRRSLVGVVLAASCVLTACGGPGSSTAASTASESGATQPAAPPTGAGCAAAGDPAELADKNLIDATKAITSTQTFATYLASDDSHQKLYGSLSDVTAFVPVDSAWTKLNAESVQQLSDPTWQQAVVQYALVPEQLAPDAFTGQQTAAMQTFRAPSQLLSGATVGQTIVLNGSVNVLCAGIAFDGGLIYLVDTVMVPSV